MYRLERGGGGVGPKDFFWGGDGGEIDHMVLGGKRRGGGSFVAK